MAMQVPTSWQHVLADELDKPYFKKLEAFVAEERRTQTVFPPEDDVFNALKYTPYDKVTVLLLGQDPYHDDQQAHGAKNSNIAKYQQADDEGDKANIGSQHR